VPPITQVQLDELKAKAWYEWDYAGIGDDGQPFEWKVSDWGILNGKSRRRLRCDCTACDGLTMPARPAPPAYLASAFGRSLCPDRA
jgi:hypothetical protein